MRYASLSLPVVLVASLVSCEGGSFEPEARSERLSLPTRQFSSATSLDNLSAEIEGELHLGPAEYTYPHWQPYTVNVSGGTAPYYHIWKARWCFLVDENSEDCDLDYGLLTPNEDGEMRSEGWGVETVDVKFWDETTRIHVVVELREAPDGYATAADSIVLYGPSFPLLFFPGENSSMLCDFDAFGYPFDEWDQVWDETEERFEWHPTGRKYHRDVCNGTRAFDPNAPDTLPDTISSN